MPSSQKAFTLIELLVVIAIIAILSVVVVLTLNPAEFLRQARDSNRLSDLATLQSAINLYNTDQGGGIGYSLGNASSVYLSLPDTSPTCANLGLPTTSPSGFNYACASSTSSRSINGIGWLPVNLASTTAGSPLGSLPVDPTNASSSGLYYAYTTNGSQFEVTALFESQKYKAQYGQSSIIPGYPEINAVGSSLSINPLFNPSGLVGYWPMDEGSGSSTQDLSGNNNLGTWAGTAAGTNGTYYSPGKVGQWAGTFDGSSTYVNLGLGTKYLPLPLFTVCAWIKTPGLLSGKVEDGIFSLTYSLVLSINNLGNFLTYLGSNPSNAVSFNLFDNSFHYVCLSYDGVNKNMYIDGINKLSVVNSWNGTGLYPTNTVTIGQDNNNAAIDKFNGLIDDVRVYNRALSAAEIQAMYNGEK